MDIKGCHSIYEMLLKNQKPQKSEENGKLSSFYPKHSIGKKPIIVNKITSDTNWRYFQFKLTIRTLPTNSLSTKNGIKDGNTCTFCKITNATLSHLFYVCHYVHRFWQTLKTLLSPRCRSWFVISSPFWNNESEQIP